MPHSTQYRSFRRRKKEQERERSGKEGRKKERMGRGWCPHILFCTTPMSRIAEAGSAIKQ